MDALINILDSHPTLIAFALNPKYEYTYFNKIHAQTMHAIWGVQIALGRNMLDYISIEEDRQKAKENFDRALQGEHFVQIEVYGDSALQRKYYEDTYAPIYNENGKIDGVSVLVKDISRQKHEEALMRKSQNLLASINQNIQDGIYRSTPEQGLIYVNKAMIRLFGYPNGKTLLDAKSEELYADPQQRETLSKILLKKGAVKNFEVLFRRFDGSVFWGLISAIASRDADNQLVFDGAIQDITQTKQAKAQLEEFQKLFKISSDLMAISNFKGYFEVLNPKWEEILGYTDEELKAQPFLHFVHPDDLDRTQQEAEELTKGKGETLKFENRYRKKNGTYVWLEWNTVIDYNSQKFYSIARDITQFKRQKNLQQRFADSLLKLSVASSLQEHTFEEFIGLLTKEGAHILEVHRLSFWRFQHNKETIDCIHLYDLGKDRVFSEGSLPVKDYPLYTTALLNKRTVAITNVHTDPITSEFPLSYFRENQIYSMLDAQVQSDDVQLGIICAEHCFEYREWKYEEENYLASLTELIANAYAIYRRKLMAVALRQSERRFRNLFMNLQIGVQLLNNRGDVMECNDKAFDLLGLSEAQLVGRSVYSTEWHILQDDGTFFPNEAYPVPRAIREKKIISEIVMGVYRPSKKDYIWLSVDAFPLFNEEGEVHQVICTFFDITARRAAIASLKESENRFRTIFQKGRLAQLLIDPSNGHIIDANEAAEKFYGYTHDELKQRTIFDINQLTEPEIRKKMQQAIENGQEFFHFQHKLASGEIREVEVYSTTLPFKDKSYIFSIIIDVTERENYEKELRETTEMLSNIADNIPGLILRYIVRPDGTDYVEYISRGVEEVWEVSQETALKDISAVWSKVPEKDLEALTLSIHESAKNLTPWNHTFKGVMPDGRVKWVNGRGIPKKLPNGNVMWDTLTLDITRLINTETEMQRLAHVAERTSDILLTCDAEGNITWVNSANYKILGVNSQEVIGLQLAEGLISEHTDMAQLAKMRLSLKEHIPYQGILFLQKRDHTPCWIQYETTPIYTEEGEFLYTIVVKKDVTDLLDKQKELEALLHTTLDQNNRLKEFSYITSHNIRSSVANLLGLTEILINDPEEIAYLELLRTTTEKLDTTIRNLSELLYFENQFNPEDRTSCSVYEAIQRVLELNRQLIEERQATVNLSVEEHLTVKAIPAYLDSIFHNLITNGIKYGLTRFSKEIDVSASQESGFVVISVRDYGTGIDLELYGHKLFKLGSRLHSTADGQGLGLYMTKNQIEALGGSIAVESKPSEGTTFTVHLPR